MFNNSFGGGYDNYASRQSKVDVADKAKQKSSRISKATKGKKKKRKPESKGKHRKSEITIRSGSEKQGGTGYGIVNVIAPKAKNRKGAGRPSGSSILTQQRTLAQAFEFGKSKETVRREERDRDRARDGVAPARAGAPPAPALPPARRDADARAEAERRRRREQQERLDRAQDRQDRLNEVTRQQANVDADRAQRQADIDARIAVQPVVFQPPVYNPPVYPAQPAQPAQPALPAGLIQQTFNYGDRAPDAATRRRERGGRGRGGGGVRGSGRSSSSGGGGGGGAGQQGRPPSQNPSSSSSSESDAPDQPTPRTRREKTLRSAEKRASQPSSSEDEALTLQQTPQGIAGLSVEQEPSESESYASDLGFTAPEPAPKEPEPEPSYVNLARESLQKPPPSRTAPPVSSGEEDEPADLPTDFDRPFGPIKGDEDFVESEQVEDLEALLSSSTSSGISFSKIKEREPEPAPEPSPRPPPSRYVAPELSSDEEAKELVRLDQELADADAEADEEARLETVRLLAKPKKRSYGGDAVFSSERGGYDSPIDDEESVSDPLAVAPVTPGIRDLVKLSPRSEARKRMGGASKPIDSSSSSETEFVAQPGGGVRREKKKPPPSRSAPPELSSDEEARIEIRRVEAEFQAEDEEEERKRVQALAKQKKPVSLVSEALGGSATSSRETKESLTKRKRLLESKLNSASGMEKAIIRSSIGILNGHIRDIGKGLVVEKVDRLRSEDFLAAPPEPLPGRPEGFFSRPTEPEPAPAEESEDEGFIQKTIGGVEYDIFTRDSGGYDRGDVIRTTDFSPVGTYNFETNEIGFESDSSY